jgi:hypothetical protein
LNGERAAVANGFTLLVGQEVRRLTTYASSSSDIRRNNSGIFIVPEKFEVIDRCEPDIASGYAAQDPGSSSPGPATIWLDDRSSGDEETGKPSDNAAEQKQPWGQVHI